MGVRTMPDVRLVDANSILKKLKSELDGIQRETNYPIGISDGLSFAMATIDTAPTIETEPVKRCKDCMYFKPAHVKCKDGTEKDYSEFPPEAFEPNFSLGVTAAYGINIGSQCVYDEWCGAYVDDKTVFRREDDYCSRFKQMKVHGADIRGDAE